MPEKSGIDAAPCAAILTRPAAGAACCPRAGVAAAANVTNKRKSRCTFMSTSSSRFAGPSSSGAPSIFYPKSGNGARLNRGHRFQGLAGDRLQRSHHSDYLKDVADVLRSEKPQKISLVVSLV